ncbi:MAG: tRNA uridine-5-carboxymethylaminomethyl(34) synthesis GTPase MnmE [Acidobacteriota bacterium]|nr:tRNA uridine-5-carboxymethylaminomethyl(34) synthesis GTPase MnmE [Acidobacteriota bacterium]
MFEHGPDDTIAAVATPPGSGGIGILRLSGPRSVAIARRIFRPRRSGGPGFPERRAVLGEIRGHGAADALDEGFLLYFRAPRSYTRQDIVEISCHGSPAVMEEALRLAVRSGARLADPGEFTFRAFLNGRLDLIQAEAVDSLVRSFTLPQAKAAFLQVRGGLSGKIVKLREDLVEILADAESTLEFPDDDLGIREADVGKRLKGLRAAVEKMVERYEAGRILREGAVLALAGRSNVGKSTLFNALLDAPRAIVSEEAGTTRDFLRERLIVKDSLFHLVDMAGLGEGRTAVEREGIRRGRAEAGSADGILFVFDRSRPSGREDLALAGAYPEKKAIFVFNKSDRPLRFDTAAVLARRPGTPALEVSALRGDNMDALREAIHGTFGRQLRRDVDAVLNLRQKLALEEIRDGLQGAVGTLAGGFRAELLAEELRPALAALGRLTGDVSTDEILASVFSRFCLGK